MGPRDCHCYWRVCRLARVARTDSPQTDATGRRPFWPHGRARSRGVPDGVAPRIISSSACRLLAAATKTTRSPRARERVAALFGRRAHNKWRPTSRYQPVQFFNLTAPELAQSSSNFSLLRAPARPPTAAQSSSRADGPFRKRAAGERSGLARACWESPPPPPEVACQFN